MARTQRGFTLIEVAVALAIVTMLLGAVLIPLQTQVENRKIEDTNQILDRAREALLGYAATYGYFPCPATAASLGMEPPLTPTERAEGKCNGSGPPPPPAFFVGYLPAALLGFSPVDEQGYATDAWGGAPAHRIRYAVAYQTVGGVTNPFTRPGGMATAGIPTFGANTALIHICRSGAGVTPGADCGTPAQTLASNVVAVVWSAGQNALTGGTSVHEAENPNPNGGSVDNVFVTRTRVTSGADEFDDQLLWISGFVAVTRLIASGQLP
ncbi:MAG TPA: type II secretion system protein [Burkholderiales bacterium]|nr:type II secretion system protein [Burkholderiales bacterium]